MPIDNVCPSTSVDFPSISSDQSKLLLTQFDIAISTGDLVRVKNWFVKKTSDNTIPLGDKLKSYLLHLYVARIKDEITNSADLDRVATVLKDSSSLYDADTKTELETLLVDRCIRDKQYGLAMDFLPAPAQALHNAMGIHYPVSAQELVDLYRTNSSRFDLLINPNVITLLQHHPIRFRSLVDAPEEDVKTLINEYREPSTKLTAQYSFGIRERIKDVMPGILEFAKATMPSAALAIVTTCLAHPVTRKMGENAGISPRTQAMIGSLLLYAIGEHLPHSTSSEVTTAAKALEHILPVETKPLAVVQAVRTMQWRALAGSTVGAISTLLLLSCVERYQSKTNHKASIPQHKNR